MKLLSLLKNMRPANGRNGRTVRVLSIDGGGIHGIIPAMVLDYMEQQTGRRIVDMFNLMAGSSTGGILACALNTPRGNSKKPANAARELLRLYRDRGPQIFSAPLWDRVTSINGWIEQLYDHRNLERYLQAGLKDVWLSDAITDLLVTGYEMEYRVPFFFKSWKAQGRYLKTRFDKPGEPETPEFRDFPLWAIARATSAGPTYFEPARIQNRAGDEFVFVDGGVFANSPSMCAYISANRIYEKVDRILMVSLGTGQIDRENPYRRGKGWGKAQWARPLINVMMDGAEETVHYQMRTLLGEDQYFRYQIDMGAFLDGGPGPSDDIGDASPENIQRLIRKGEMLLREQRARLDLLCETLVEDKDEVGYAVRE